MNLNSFKFLSSILYSDILSTQRWKKVTPEDYVPNEDGSVPDKYLDGTTSEYLENYLYDIPCRLSFKSDDRTYMNDSLRNPNTSVITVFVDPSVDIKKGDKLKIKKTVGETSKVYEGLANEPRLYNSHLEVILSLTDEGAYDGKEL